MGVLHRINPLPSQNKGLAKSGQPLIFDSPTWRMLRVTTSIPSGAFAPYLSIPVFLVPLLDGGGLDRVAFGKIGLVDF